MECDSVDEEGTRKRRMMLELKWTMKLEVYAVKSTGPHRYPMERLKARQRQKRGEDIGTVLDEESRTRK